MAPAPQTVLALSSSPLPSLPSISLLPFSLAHDGPAPISTYFRPRPYPSTFEAEPAHRQASFRGRRVVSTVLSLPEGYQGLVFSTSAPLPPTAAQDEVDEASQEREERAAKRAKRAAASAAALATSALEEDEGDSAAADGLRRSPRKGTAVSTAAARARDRAVRAAKEKAKKAAAAKGQKKGGFSLDSDEEEEVTEQPEEQEMTAIEVQETQVVETNAGTLEITSAEQSTTIEVVAAPPPAPLRTTSALSTASASQIPSTPLTTTASFSSLNPFDAPVALARDEKHLRPCATFDTIEVWNPDWPVAGGRVAEEDAVGKTVSEWMRLASKILDSRDEFLRAYSGV